MRVLWESGEDGRASKGRLNPWCVGRLGPQCVDPLADPLVDVALSSAKLPPPRSPLPPTVPHPLPSLGDPMPTNEPAVPWDRSKERFVRMQNCSTPHATPPPRPPSRNAHPFLFAYPPSPQRACTAKTERGLEHTACFCARRSVRVHLAYDAGTNGPAALAESEPHAYFNRHGLDQLARHVSIVPRHYHLRRTRSDERGGGHTGPDEPCAPSLSLGVPLYPRLPRAHMWLWERHHPAVAQQLLY